MRTLMLLMPLIVSGCGPTPAVRLTDAAYENGVLCAVYAHELYVRSNLQHGVQVGPGMEYQQWKAAAASIPGSIPSINHPHK